MTVDSKAGWLTITSEPKDGKVAVRCVCGRAETRTVAGIRSSLAKGITPKCHWCRSGAKPLPLEKTCTGCKRLLPIEQFDLRSDVRKLDGARMPKPECKECSARRSSTYRYSREWHEQVEEATITKFWSYVTRADGCWLWSGTKHPKDQRAIFFAPPRNTRAARFMWFLHTGNAPGDLHVLHKCDNPGCVNPDHLFLGTTYDNIADRVAKGRTVAPLPRRRITLEQEQLVVSDYAELGVAKAALKHGLPISTVWNAAHRNGVAGSRSRSDRVFAVNRADRRRR